MEMAKKRESKDGGCAASSKDKSRAVGFSEADETHEIGVDVSSTDKKTVKVKPGL